MAVVIRLQGLRITAGSQDIRKFFTGLKIPDGGVHIIGGEREEAFIIFASDEDARRAMTRSGGFIQGSQVTLLLSSKTEMQNVLERSTRDEEHEPQRPRDEKATFARRPVDAKMNRRSAGRCDFAPMPRRHAASNWHEDTLYVFLRGMPFSVTEDEVYNFFGGLNVDDIILFKNKRGLKNGGGLVKFASREDARDSLKRDRGYIGARYVEIFPASEDDWCQAGGARPLGVNNNRQFEREASPLPKRGKPQRPGRSRSPLAERRPAPSGDEEFCILLENLFDAVEKDDIKRLFRSANLEDDQILCLTGEDGTRTRSAFVLFTNRRDYDDAVAYEKRPLFNRWIYIHPISRKKMLTILESSNVDVQSTGKGGRFEGRPTSNSGGSYESKKLCVFVQNLSPDVRKVEIIDLFFEFNVAEDDVFLLGDDSGSGMGRALVLFRSEAMASRALSLSGTRVHGVEVTLKCVSPSEIWDCGVEPSVLEGSPSGDAPFQGSWSKASDRSVEIDHSISNDHDGPMNDETSNVHGGLDYDSFGTCPQSPQDGGNFSGGGGGHSSSSQHFDGPTCVKLFNLPFQIRSEEIYDFCYGFRVIPGSVSLQYDESGAPQGTATLVFETRQEATAAVGELSGRPIGPRKIQLVFV